MKKIIFVNYSLDMGGAETLILDICRGLDPKKFEPMVCCLVGNGILQGEFEKSGIPVHVIGKRSGIDLSLSFRFMKLFKKLKIDIVNTHGSANWLFAGIAAKMCGIPLIHTEHTKPYFNLKKWMKIEKVMSIVTNQIITVGAKVARFMIDEEGISEKKIKVIYNGIRTELYELNIDVAKKRAEIGVGEKDIVIGVVARLFPNKDHKMLFHAFKKVAYHIPLAKLVLVGDGPLKSDLIATAEELDITNKVIFLGNRRDIPELLQTFNVFALSSILEGLPIVLLEAMAAELPIVATNVDGNPELVINGETGYIVPPREPDLFADALIKLLSNSCEAKEMGLRGKERVRKHFSYPSMMKDYNEIYGKF